MEEIGRTGASLDRDRLAFVLKALRQRFRDEEELLSFCLAAEILDYFLGRSWTNENIHSPHKEISKRNRSSRKFLRTEATVIADVVRYQQLVVDLAELCFNFQNVEGFRPRLVHFSGHDLESALGELRSAALFSAPSFCFRFIAPSGTLGQDYEDEFRTTTGQIVCCEMKTKCEQTDLSSESLRNSLRKARQQLPSGKPGIVCIWLPESWIMRQELAVAVQFAIDAVFDSKRLVAVLARWQEWHKHHDGWAVFTRWRPFLNDASPLLTPDIREAIALAGTSQNPERFRLREFVKSKLGST